MIFEFLSYVQDIVIQKMIENRDHTSSNYFLLDLAYVILHCLNNSMSVSIIERDYGISHSTMSQIFIFWENYVSIFFYIILYFFF